MKSPAPSELLVHFRKQDGAEESVRPLDWGLISRLYQYTLPYTWKRNWLFVCVLFRSIQLPALTWAITAIIRGPIASKDPQGLILGTVGFAMLALSTLIIGHFRQRLALELGELVVHDLRRDIFEHIHRLTMSFFNRTRIGWFISRMSSDVENIRIGVQEVFFVTVVVIGQMAFSAIAMCWYDPVLFLLVLLVAPVLWMINRRFREELSQAHRDVQESFSRVTATLAESVNGIRITQSFVREDRNSELFRELVSHHATYNYRVNKKQAQLLPLLDINNEWFIALLLVVGGYRVLTPGFNTEVGELVGFFFMANLFFAPISILGTQYNQALTAMAGAERVFALLDTKPDWVDPPEARNLETIQGRVELRNVNFGYDKQTRVLHDVSLKVEPGESIGLVGHTGCGKTTLVNLIGKFYLRNSGELLIDGVEIESIRTDWYATQVAYVLQTNFLFSGTVMENIRFGKLSASDEEVLETARRLDCLEILENLPQGFQTEVGERGGLLSLGQRQLVCFCRALIANPKILILDEATSSIDPITELQIQIALRKLIQGRTSFIIVHRLSTIRHCDQILVIDHGRIVERGTYQELITQDGQFARLERSFTRLAG